MGVEDGSTTMDEKVKVEAKKGRFSINKNLVMLKMTLFFLYGGKQNLKGASSPVGGRFYI